ncbi:HEAT repeat domain-containing protein [Pedosphaera parvula]|uniref:HEAT repeat domain-containing protein n=1 Tax=Pedosphaera parvula TaxID=1032527 RepID=UPI00135F1472|nr:hypothetical protein [Pedosphaera parvula]
MSKRTGILILLCLSILGLLTCLSLSQREPTYQGKGITFWLDQYFEVDYGNIPTYGNFPTVPTKSPAKQFELKKQARLAIQAIGTNALPALLKMTAATDSALKLKMMGMVSRQHAVNFGLKEDWYYHNLSRTGFQILGPAAGPAIPALTNLLYDAEPDVRDTALFNLGSIGPQADEAIQTVAKHCVEDEEFSCLYNLETLVSVQKQPRFFIPLLINKLRKPQTNITIYKVAIIALGQYGPDASSAVPEITRFLTNQIPSLASAASNALKQINPAAAQASVK